MGYSAGRPGPDIIFDIVTVVEIRYRNPISMGQNGRHETRQGIGDKKMSSRDLMAGFVRLHVLNDANARPVFGIGIIERLAFHGYVLSPGTLYPILHGLERDGFLESRDEIKGNRRRRIYQITEPGRRVLILSKVRLWELFKEVFERELSPDTAGHVEKALRVAVARANAPPDASRPPAGRTARRARQPSRKK
jgi:PadR family transcriptional regulator, regulatory protein PadR